MTPTTATTQTPNDAGRHVPSGLTLQAFSFTLDPTPGLESVIRRHFGARSFAYNWTAADIRKELSPHRESEVSFGPVSLACLRRRRNRNKHRLAVDVECVCTGGRRSSRRRSRMVLLTL